MLERHREKLSQLPIYSSHRKRTNALSGNFFARFEGAIEFRLDVAVEMAKEQNRGKGVRHAVRILQRRAVERRKASAGQGPGTGQGEQRLREADAMKDPEVKRQWEKLRQEWLHKWPTEITSPADRYVPCKECHKPMVKKESGTCDYCVWYDIWWNQGGIRVDRQNWGEV